jgi:hypothetical protein
MMWKKMWHGQRRNWAVLIIRWCFNTETDALGNLPSMPLKEGIVVSIAGRDIFVDVGVSRALGGGTLRKGDTGLSALSEQVEESGLK